MPEKLALSADQFDGSGSVSTRPEALAALSPLAIYQFWTARKLLTFWQTRNSQTLGDIRRGTYVSAWFAEEFLSANPSLFAKR